MKQRLNTVVSWFVCLLVICSGRPAVAQINGEAARDWPVVFRDTLQHTVLQFWIDHSRDKQFGGLLGQLDRKGMPTGSGNKSVVLISRSLWSFSEAYRRYPDPAYKEMAAECLKFLREKMWDKQKGGYYFMVSREGNIVDSTKQLNPMSYVMEGLAEYALAFHDNQVAREALECSRSSTSTLTTISTEDIESRLRKTGSGSRTTNLVPMRQAHSDGNPTTGIWVW